MKTNLFFTAALFITTIAFSQSSKKGYDYYNSKSNTPSKQQMNKSELIDAIAKENKVETKIVSNRKSTGKVQLSRSARPTSARTKTGAGKNPGTKNNESHRNR